jgi:hypothetical protein
MAVPMTASRPPWRITSQNTIRAWRQREAGGHFVTALRHRVGDDA